MSCHVQTEECGVALYRGKEKKQLRYIREYAKAHNIEIVKIYRRGILGQYEVNRHFNALLEKLLTTLAGWMLEHWNR